MLKTILAVAAMAAAAVPIAHAQSGETGICIAAGQASGRYLALAEQFETASEGVVCPIETAGSVENLLGLQSAEYDFVIAQNDLAFHLFNGDFGFERWRGFSVIAPLFPEFVHLVVRREPGEPVLLGDLRGRTINVGVAGSGGSVNARDVLTAAGLREGVDFLPSTLATREALEALSAGDVDAVFLTASSGFELDPDRFRQLALPPGVVRELAQTNAYYETVVVDLEGQPATVLAVRAYLLARNDAPRTHVRLLAGTVFESWPDLSAEFEGLYPPDQLLIRSPLPFHPVARDELVSRDLSDPPPAYGLWIAIWGLLFLVSFVAVTFQTTYDRTGARRERRGRYAILQTAIDWWARPSPWVIGVSVFVLTLLIALVALRTAEAAHARALNLDNPFADLTLNEGFIWMLTFVASGFTENNAYPLSVTGRILVATLAFIGVSGPIAGIIIVVNLWGRRRTEKIAGLSRVTWKDHILVCGWNEHLDGIVYALTGNDAESSEKVCIVAQSGDATPLRDHRFDASKVSFRRGDSADRETLERANAAHAKQAIILADYGRRSTRNIGAVLTAMNLKRLNPNIRISAELAFDQNADHFAAFGCSTLITPDIFVAKAAALSTIHPLIIDYLLEVLTYDAFDELFSITYAELCAEHSGVSAGMTAAEVEERLWASGASLVGLVKGELQRKAVFDAEITDGGPILTFTRPSGHDYAPQPEDRIIYSAHKRQSVFKDRGFRDVLDATPIPREKFRLERPSGKAILLYASRAHIERLEANLRAFHKDPVIDAIAIEDLPFLTADSLLSAIPADTAYDHVLILANAESKRDADSDGAVRAVDAATLLATKLLSEHARRHNWDCEIVAEVLAREDREAFAGNLAAEVPARLSLRRPETGNDLGAGATAVVPSATLTERFLVKDVFDGNAVLDFIIGVMNMRDGTHLFMHEVETDDPLVGETYASLIRTRLPGLHLIGWLPVTRRENLRNRAGDFGFHFRTAFDDRIVQKDIQPGDLLVFAACFRIWEAEADEAG